MKPFMFMFPPAKLKAALIFAAKDDIRYYLNGLYFEPWRGGVVCVATDGHRLVAIFHGAAFNGLEHPAKPFQVILPRDEIERALKCQDKQSTRHPARSMYPVTILPNGGSGARVCIDDPDVISVVMPMRTDGLLQPDWFYAPEEKREAA